ncbi:hypothetical protein [Photobacterium leiognathi]|uniref:hypothetical protein n=1 Tax=Photobacterium leiognathi TaxID=553611 RepID=UPI001F3FD9C8|nr:hypothetical protein [Photobacterium leiognathi]
MHVCILNKFPIVVPHLLICAKDYIPQTSPLILSDFKAWVEGISDSGVLGFFNSGGNSRFKSNASPHAADSNIITVRISHIKRPATF